MNLTSRLAPLGALLLVSALAAGLSAQTTVNVPCNLDNTLYQDLSGSISNGIGPNIFVGQSGTGLRRRAVVRFDVAGSIPANASIVAASIRLEVNQTASSTAMDIDGHRITQAWGEGNSTATGGAGGGGAGGPAAAGDATWIHTFWNGSFWTTPGGDFAALPSFTAPMPTFGTFTIPASPGLVADVQSWVNAPATNFGWLLKSVDESIPANARRINSRQATTGKPVLSVTYLLPGQTAVWGTGCPSGSGTFDFSFGGPMIGGTTVSLDHVNGTPSGIGFNIFALELYQPGAPLLPGCNAYLPLSGAWIFGNVILFDAVGTGSSPWPVPTNYPGLYFMSQTVALATNALGLIVSNAGVAVIQ
jgi:hypothetical protein